MKSDNDYIQPCVYTSGLWVAAMCPHKFNNNTQLIIKDSKYIIQELSQRVINHENK
tara:strand:+ start:624 stop:791 length:168 start_codon:yes stop_codon:yes gene_type:complete